MATTRHDRATNTVLTGHLDRLREADSIMEFAAAEMRRARSLRDAAIRSAVDSGLSLRQVGGALGLSAQGVSATLDGGRAAYDTLGQTYAQTRRPDPRIRDMIWDALGGAGSVVNLGAGTGSYEPPQTILAVEPSMVMIAQRPPELAPAAVTTAARIPLPDKSVDAALASLTIHHWSDREACFAEILRVTRKRVVIFTWDHQATKSFWLGEYIPAIWELDAQIEVPIPSLCQTLDTEDVRVVPVPHDCSDGFMGAFWRRPEAYLDPVVRAGISTLSRVDQSVVKAGLELLLEDLQSGAWRRRYADLLDLEELDLGYRLVVAELP
jgi:SAM-dependent methyltransferase